MNAADSQRLIQHIRRLAGDPQSTLSDGELLRRYLIAQDEAAFTALVRRHGPMVFSVCQSVLRQRHDAEDAFQAAFLILARKAGSIRRHEGLGGWLQRVAYRVALQARTDKLRRQEREAKAARSPMDESSSDELSWGELRAFLHAELAALPELLRAPLVLCYLEGLTQEEAARRLGWTAATVKGRLQRGRDKLRRRLERCGIALTAAMAAALTGQALAETAVRSSGLLTMTTASTAAAALARGFLRPLLPIKLAMLSAVLLSLGIVAGGMALRSPSEPRPSGSDPSPVKPAEKQPEPQAAVDAHGDPLPDGAVARLGTIRFNHGDGLHSLVFSADGKTIISEGNGSIRFWDARNGKELDNIRTDKGSFVFPTILFADGKTLISLSERIDGDVATFWDLAAKKRFRTKKLPVRRSVLSTNHQDSLSPDGKLCVMHVHTPAHVQVSDVTTGKNLYQLGKGSKEFLAVAFAGNDRLVSADANQRIEVWQAQTGKLLHQFIHDAPIRFLLASPDGRWLVSLEKRPQPPGRNVEQEIVYLWDMKTGKIAQTFRAKPKHWFTNVCFSSDSKTLLTSSRNPWEPDEVVLWDRATGRRLLTFDAASGINADIAAISPDGSRLASGNSAGKFELWDLKYGHRLTSEDSRHIEHAAVVLAPTGERATIIGQGSISFWDATSGRCLHSFDLPLGPSSHRSLSSDGHYAATYRVKGEEFHALIWDIAAGKCLHTLRFPGGFQQITSTFTPDSTLLATWHPGEPTVVRLWDVRSGKQVRTFADSKAGWPGRLSFTADGKTLFVAGKHIVGYEVSTGKELFSWRLKPPLYPLGPRGAPVGGAPVSEDDRIGWGTLAISPEGTLIAVTPWPGNATPGSKEDAIALYEARSGKLLRRCHDPNASRNTFRQLTFSADGQLLASTNGREIIYLWEVATGKRIHTFKGHQGQINHLIFSGDDRRLASVSSDSTVLIWDVTGAPAKASALTEAKLKEYWNDLAEEDAGRAHRAVWTLIRAPRESVAFLKARLHPVKPVRREQLDRWIQDLDAAAFDIRQKAAAELEKLGERAEPALRRALENKPTLEQRRRIEPILTELEAKLPSGDVLQSLRAVRVLEHIDTAEARRLLRELANGAEGAWLTRAAQAALTRMDRSPSKKTP
jgi:RNA polymerase sigma factor (sigma-70 family)